MNKHFTKLFWKFLIPYLCIMLFMFMLTYLIYYVSFSEIEDNAVQMQKAYMDQSQAVLDRQFKEVTDASYEVAQMPIVRGFRNQYREDIEENFMPVSDLYNHLKNIRMTNEAIAGYYVFFENSEMIATNKYIRFYDTLTEESLMSYDKDFNTLWANLFHRLYTGEVFPKESYRVESVEVDVIPVLTSVGFSYEEPDAVVMVLINTMVIEESMKSYGEYLEGNFMIVNEQGEILMALDNSIGINEAGVLNDEALDEDYMTFRAKSEVIDWEYVLIQPENVVFGEIYKFRNYGVAVTGFTILVGILLSFMWAKYNTKPVEVLISDNEALSNRVKGQIPYLRKSHLERWLTGSYNSKEEILSVTNYLKAKYLGHYYMVLVIDYNIEWNVMKGLPDDYIEDMETKGLYIEELLSEKVFKPEFIHRVANNRLAAICVSSHEDLKAFESEIKERIKQCEALISQEDLSYITLGVGHIYEEMMEVSTSMANAVEAVNTVRKTKVQQTVWYSEITRDNDHFYYPSEIENRLINAVKTGDLEETEGTLRSIFKVNILEKSLVGVKLNLFIYELWGTLAKLQEQFKTSPEIQSEIEAVLNSMESLPELTKVMTCKSAFIKCCEMVRVDSANKHNQLMDEIIVYIEEHYTQLDFGMPMVADAFDLSYTYISQMFKENHQENFMTYVQGLRIAEAKRLLIETNKPVKQIFLACGYNSSNTFGKAFKRMVGITASEFRAKHQEISLKQI